MSHERAFSSLLRHIVSSRLCSRHPFTLKQNQSPLKWDQLSGLTSESGLICKQVKLNEIRNIIGSLHFEENLDGSKLWEEVCLRLGPVIQRRNQKFILSTCDLLEKSALLESHGMNTVQLFEQPGLLLLDSSKLQAKIQQLQELEIPRITTYLMKIFNIRKKSRLLKVIEEYIEVIGEADSHVHYLANQLQCPVNQIFQLHKIYPGIVVKDLIVLDRKIKLLKEARITSASLLSCIVVLEKNFDVLEQRIQLMSEAGMSPSVGYLAQGDPKFHRTLNRFRATGDRCRRPVIENRLQHMCQLLRLNDPGDLEVMLDDLPNRAFVERMLCGVTYILQPKLDALRSGGVSVVDLLQHIYILDFRLESICRALEELITPATALQVIKQIRQANRERLEGVA